MNFKTSFAFNTFIIGISKFIEHFFTFLIIIIISRQLGSEGLGIYSFLFSLAGLFYIFSDFGLPSVLTKMLSKNFSKINIYFSSIINLKIILLILVTIFFLIFVIFYESNLFFFHFFLVGSILSIQGLSMFWYNILTVKNKSLRLAFANIFERTFAFFGAYIVLIQFKDLFFFLIILLVSNFLKFLFLLYLSKEYYNYKFEIDIGNFFYLIKKGVPFILIGAFYMIYSRIDTIMLGFMSTYEIVGYYNAGYKLIETFSIIITILITFGFPMMSNKFQEHKEEAKTLFQNLLTYSIILALPLSIGILFLADRILEFLYGFGSLETIISFQILSLSILFSFLTSIMVYLLIAVDKQKIFAWISGGGALINIILNLLLIPQLSLYGAAVSTVITFFLMYLAMHIYIYRNIFKFKFSILPSLISTSFMAIFLSRILEFHLLIIVFLSILVYFFIIAIFYITEVREYKKEFIKLVFKK